MDLLFACGAAEAAGAAAGALLVAGIVFLH
jgi:hypothetical protein